MLRFPVLANLTALIGLGFLAPASYAALLGQYDFGTGTPANANANNLAPSSVANNLSFSNFGSGSGVTNPGTNTNGFATGNPNPAIIRTSWGSSFTNNDYFNFSVTPTNSSTINLSNLVFDAQRSNTGPNTIEIRSSLDNYASAIASSSSIPTSFGSRSFNLSSLTNISQPLDLRIYGYGASGTTGTLRLDNVQLNGDVGTPTPAPVVSIYNIQGTGSASSYVGQTVQTQGVVVGSFLGSDKLNGFFIQDNTNANDPTITGASNGIFVSAPSVSSLDVGALVQVFGQVSENFNRTQISLTNPLSILGTGLSVTPTPVTLPVASSDYLERYEGMSVVLPQTLTATNNFTLGRFGEVGLSSSERLYQPTQVAAPGASANAVQAANLLNLITLDDGSNIQNPDPIPYPSPVPPGLTANNTLRTGETTTGVTGVLDYGFSAYRIQPTTEPSFITAPNPRPQTPASVG
jgi:hypothetical protein